MKVLHLNSSGKRGIIPELINAIASNSVFKHELLTGWEPSLEVESHTIGTKFGYYRNITASRLFDNDGFSRGLYNKTLSQLEKISPDVLHLHNLHGYWSNFRAVSDYIQMYSPNVVWTIHDQWPLTGRCCYIQSCQNHKHDCNTCPTLKEYPRTLIDHASRNFQVKQNILKNIIPYSTFVFPSNSFKISFKDLPISKSRAKVIYNSVNIDKINSPHQPTTVNKNLGFIANKWSDIKGFADIIKISNQLSSEFQVNVLGVSDTQKRLLNRYQIKSFARTNSREKVNQFIDQQDVVVVPSREESFGMLPLECATRGIPVLAYKIPAFKELYSKFKLVRLHDCYDADAIAESLNSGILSELTGHEPEVNLKPFDRRYMVNQYDNVYQEITK